MQPVTVDADTRDPALEPGCDLAMARDVIDHDGGEKAGAGGVDQRPAAGQRCVAVAAAKDVFVGRHLVHARPRAAGRRPEPRRSGCRAAWRGRGEGHAGDLREPSGAVLDLGHAVLERGEQVVAGQLDQHDHVAERQLPDDVLAGQNRAGSVGAITADAAAVHQREVGADAHAHGVGDQVAEVGSPAVRTMLRRVSRGVPSWYRPAGRAGSSSLASASAPTTGWRSWGRGATPAVET